MKSSGSYVGSFGVGTLPELRVANPKLVSYSLINRYLASLLGGYFDLNIGLNKPRASVDYIAALVWR